MNCVLCRIMVIVFLVNCLAPNYGWGQTGRSSSKKSLETQLERKVTAAPQKISPATRFEYADNLVRFLHNEWFAQADRNPKKIIPVPPPQKRAAQRLQAMPSLPQDNTYTTSRAFSNPVVDQPDMYVQGFLKTIGKEQPAKEVPASQIQMPAPPKQPSARQLPQGFADKLQNPDSVSIANSPKDFPTSLQEGIVPSPQAFSSLPDHHNNHAQEFLKQVANNEIGFEDLIEYADPMDPDLAVNDLPTIAYAAEILGNSIDEAEQADTSSYNLADLLALLPYIQARLLYRLAILGHISPSYSLNETETPVSISRSLLETSYKPSIAKTEAVSTLRITLLKIHRFYQTKNQPDPVEEYQKQMLAKQMKDNFLRFTTKSEAERSGSSAANTPNTARDRQFMQRALHTTRRSGNIPSFYQNFLTEMRLFLAQKPEEESFTFQHLQILAEYATTYALEYDPTKLKEIVALLDNGPDATDFKQTYAPIINAVFITLLEHVRDLKIGEDKLKPFLSLLEEFSDPQKYSLPTRVCALEVASFFFRPLNTPENINEPNKTLRLTFAQRTADIYCPTTSEVANQAHLTLKKALKSQTFVDETALNNYTLSPNGIPTSSAHVALKKAFSSSSSNETVMQTYGLSSEEMQTFANKLAYIYDGFFDIHTPSIRDPNVGAANLGRENYPATQCHIVLKNLPNPLKRTSEAAAEIFDFSIAALFFIYVGPAFSMLGTAFRLTRGAAVALPRAATAYRVAKNGSKIKSFYETVKDGSQFANAVYKNKNRGRTIQLIVKNNNPGVAVAEEAQAPTRLVTVDRTYKLEGEFSSLNPKRWLGKRPDQEVVGMQVVQVEPQGAVVARAEFTNGEFADGIHSMSQLKDAWSRLRLVTDLEQPLPYKTGSHFLETLKFQEAQTKLSLTNALDSSLPKSMDFWGAITDLPPANVYTIGDYFTISRPWTAKELAAHTKWWNFSRWPRPPMGRPLDDVFVATRSGSVPKAVFAKGVDLPSNLLGFPLTWGDIASGRLGSTAFDYFFKPMPWTTAPTKLLTNYGRGATPINIWQHKISQTLGRFFLPDFVPTPLFWQTLKANPAFAMRMGAHFFLTQRWTLSAISLGLWEGSDYLVYPFFRAWLEHETDNDTQKETSKYGETFSPERLAEETWLTRKAGIGPTYNDPTGTFDSVLQSQREHSSGTLLSIPLVLAQRTLGKVPGFSWMYLDFVDPASKAGFAHEAFEKDLRYARLKQSDIQLNNKEKSSEKNVSLKKRIDKLYNQMLSELAFGFSKVPHVKKQLRDLFDKYLRDFPAANSKQARDQINRDFLQQQNEILSSVDVWQNTHKKYLDEIQALRNTYAQDPRFITPQTEQQIWTIYETYVEEYLNTLSLTQNGLKQNGEQHELETQFQAAISKMHSDLSAWWKAQHPLSGYNGELKLHEKAFAVMPQYKEPLKNLITGFSADMNTARDEQQRTDILSQFQEHYDELMASVTSWENIIKDGEKAVASTHETYPNLVTPAQEEEIRAIYEQYAAEYINLVLTLPEEKQQKKAAELLQSRDAKVGVIWNVLRKRNDASQPQKSYQKLLQSYPDGFDILPQYKKPLEELYTRFAADMKTVKTEQAEAALIKDFEQKVDQFKEPVQAWNSFVKKSNSIITRLRYNYQDLVTPAIEQQVRQIYKAYTTKYIQSVLPLPKDQRKNLQELLEQQRDQQIEAITDSLELKWRLAHPLPLRQAVRSIQVYNDEPEYGTQWNAHLGQQ